MYLYIYIFNSQSDSHINVLNRKSESVFFFTLFGGTYLSLHKWKSCPLPAGKALCLLSAHMSLCTTSLWPSSYSDNPPSSFILQSILSSLANLLPSPSKSPLYSPSSGRTSPSCHPSNDSFPQPAEPAPPSSHPSSCISP